MISDNSIKSLIANLEIELNNIDSKVLAKVETSLSSGYRPELDSSKELTPRQVSLYQGLIGTLRWMCELRRVEILMLVCLLSSYLMSSSIGRLEEAIHYFMCLKYNHEMVFLIICMHLLRALASLSMETGRHLQKNK